MILGGKFSGQIKWGYGEVKQARQRTKGAGRDMTRLREKGMFWVSSNINFFAEFEFPIQFELLFSYQIANGCGGRGHKMIL